MKASSRKVKIGAYNDSCRCLNSIHAEDGVVDWKLLALDLRTFRSIVHTLHVTFKSDRPVPSTHSSNIKILSFRSLFHTDSSWCIDQDTSLS